MKKFDISLTPAEKKGLLGDLQEYAMVKKLFLQIAPHCRRDPQFFYGADKPKEKVQAYDSKLEYDEDGINDVVCKNISKWMVHQLALNGLNARIVSCDSDRCRHIDVLLITKSGKTYLFNPLENLELAQTHMRTNCNSDEVYYNDRYAKFEKGKRRKVRDISDSTLTEEEREAILEHDLFDMDLLSSFMGQIQFITDEETENVDKNLGYGRYTDNSIPEIKEAIGKAGNDVQTTQKVVETILKKFPELNNIKGHTDLIMYLSRILIPQFLTPEQRKNIIRYDGIIDNAHANVLTTDEFAKGSDGKTRCVLIKVGDKCYMRTPNDYSEVDLEKLKEQGVGVKQARHLSIEDPIRNRGIALPVLFTTEIQTKLGEIEEYITENFPEDEVQGAINFIAQFVETKKSNKNNLEYISVPDLRYLTEYGVKNREELEEIIGGMYLDKEAMQVNSTSIDGDLNLETFTAMNRLDER